MPKGDPRCRSAAALRRRQGATSRGKQSATRSHGGRSAGNGMNDKANAFKPGRAPSYQGVNAGTISMMSFRERDVAAHLGRAPQWAAEWVETFAPHRLRRGSRDSTANVSVPMRGPSVGLGLVRRERDVKHHLQWPGCNEAPVHRRIQAKRAAAALSPMSSAPPYCPSAESEAP